MSAILLAVILFHLLILAQIIPYNIAWGGKLANVQEMYMFEIISLAINTLLLWVVLQKAGWRRQVLSHRFIQIVLIVFAVLFTLNTLGNLMANNWIEKVFGTVLTTLLAWLCLNLAIREKRVD